MNDDMQADSTKRARRRRVRWWRGGAMLAVVAALALGLAACGGGGGGGGSAKSGSSGGSSSGGSSSSSKASNALKLTACMRSHGVTNFPEPGPNGNIQITPNLNIATPTFHNAMQACAKYGTGGASSTPSQSSQAQDLKYAQCMRSHGVTNFPDPNSQGNFPTGGLDTNSPTFTSANNACQSLLPGGS